MAYPSIALIDFRVNVETVRRLATLEAVYDDPPPAADAATVRALRGGLCVLLVGALELFLRESIAEHLEDLTGCPPPVALDALPTKLRTSTAFESMSHAMTGPRHGGPTTRIARLPAVLAAATRLSSGQIDPDALAQTKGNPNSERVRALFKAIGAGNPFETERASFDAAWVRQESGTFVADKLDELVNARHVVAHTANALGITRANLTEWPLFAEVLGDLIDRRLQNFVGDIVASA